MQNLSYPTHAIDHLSYIWQCERRLFVPQCYFGNWKYIYKDIQDMQIPRTVNPEFAGMTCFGNSCLYRVAVLFCNTTASFMGVITGSLSFLSTSLGMSKSGIWNIWKQEIHSCLFRSLQHGIVCFGISFDAKIASHCSRVRSLSPRWHLMWASKSSCELKDLPQRSLLCTALPMCDRKLKERLEEKIRPRNTNRVLELCATIDCWSMVT